MSPLWFDPPPAGDAFGTIIKDDYYRKVTNKKEIKGYLCHVRPAAFPTSERKTEKRHQTMKKFLAPIAVALTAMAATACCDSNRQLTANAITIDSLLTVAEVYIGDTMTVYGLAIADGEGESFFITDSARTNKIRIVPTADCKTQGSVETGALVCAKGVLCEDRTTKFELDAKAAEADSLLKAGAITEDVCEKVRNAIAAKKAYIEFTGRFYYSEYFIRGTQVEGE